MHNLGGWISIQDKIQGNRAMTKNDDLKRMTITVTDENGESLTQVTVMVPFYNEAETASALESFAENVRAYGGAIRWSK